MVGRALDTGARAAQERQRGLYKTSVERHLRFQLGAGNLFTAVEHGEQRAWLNEAIAHAEVQAGEDAGLWLGVDYALPVAHGGELPGAESLALAPQVRFSLQIGAVANLDDTGWQLFAVYSLIDRGEPGQPATTLPIVDGGFDQAQTKLGVAYRFRDKKRNARRYRSH